MKRVILIILDSVGCGDAPDASKYGDEGANTLKNMARAVGGLDLPNLGKLGIGHLTDIQGVPPIDGAAGVYGRLTEVSAGKDTTTGHWELAGMILDQPFPTYPQGFPADWMARFEARIGRKTLGNYPASGTEIIKALGEEHIRTGKPIVYTSADSVFQIAAHEEVIPVDELYRLCRIAREMLVGEHAVGRVIARPFIGQPGNFTRTERRKDFSRTPTSDTILDVIKQAGLDVMAVGKIEDIFAHRGMTMSIHSGNNMAGVDAVLEFLEMDKPGLIFANLVDFDALFGHRRDPRGYANALQAFDQRLPEIIQSLHDDDVLMITADHGNDPTFSGTDHTRERVPLLVVGQPVQTNVHLGTRSSYADVAATVADLLGAEWHGAGDSFVKFILR
ncbi:MAG: phosphopentomutase [candidate division KSB1 bacterium]|nr:phosphopentomutase [candidate division KSB1 bacterium]